MQSRVKPEVVSRRVRGRWRRHEVTQLRQSSPWFLYDIHFRFYVVTNIMFLFYRRHFLCSFLLRLSSVLFLSDYLWGHSADCFLLYLYSIIQTLYATIILDTKLDNFVPCKIPVNPFNLQIIYQKFEFSSYKQKKIFQSFCDRGKVS